MSLWNALAELFRRPAAGRGVRPLGPAGGRHRPYRPRLELLEDRTLLSVFTVNHLADDTVGTGTSGSLRYAITNAVNGDTINFAVTGTISLTDYLPELTHNISINGPGPDLLTVDGGGGTCGVFYVYANVAISGLSITGSGGLYSTGPGGIWNVGSLTLSNCTISNNSASGAGGGIWNGGTALVNNCTISNNTAEGYGDDPSGAGTGGGGIANMLSGTMTIENSTIFGNTAIVDGSTVSRGGGVYNSMTGSLLVMNSTITGNVAQGSSAWGGSGFGGGIETDSWGPTTIENSTITGNTADQVGGIRNTGPLTLRNCILAGNTGVDLGGTLTSSSGYNLIGGNPLLGPLQNNGGPTKTMALLAGSPALNTGDPAQLGVPDQRGVIRSGGVNIGAYQASASAFVLTAPATVTAGVAFDVTLMAVDPFGQVALGYTGTVSFATTDTNPAVVLPAVYTFTAVDHGTHTFTRGYTLVTPGPQTLTTTDTSIATLTGSLVITVA
jgi:hypothetical protein